MADRVSNQKPVPDLLTASIAMQESVRHSNDDAAFVKVPISKWEMFGRALASTPTPASPPMEHAAEQTWPIVNPDDAWRSASNQVAKARHRELVGAVLRAAPLPAAGSVTLRAANTLLNALDAAHAKGETFPARVSVAAAALRAALTVAGSEEKEHG